MTMRKFNKQIFTAHFLFWTVYFCFFLYQLSPTGRSDGEHSKPKMMLLPPSGLGKKPLLPTDTTINKHIKPKIDVDFKPFERTFTSIILDAVIHVLMMLLLAYFNYFYLLERFLKDKMSKKRYFLSISLAFTLCIVALMMLKSLINHQFLAFENSLFFKKSFIFELSLSTLFILVFVSLLKFLENYVAVETQKKELENERLRTELAQLKAQINPHFLFNAFNNLYALSLQNSEKTPQTIEKLAEIMRYSLYESGKKEVELEKEINLIENILDMERLHLGENGTIVFNKKVDKIENVRIAPMILITFLENAFKHGTKGAKTDVDILLTYENKTLTYQLKNKVEKGGVVLEKSGIGLKNVERQLALYYPNQHELKVEKEEDFYDVVLKIKNLS
jgi:two-component system, LytTR family, sensor histidine kinase AlgZ